MIAVLMAAGSSGGPERAAAADTQLLRNPGFEVIGEDNQPAGWLYLGGDCVLDSVVHPQVDPPPETYPEGERIVRAFATAWGMVWSPAGWLQTVRVVPGETYTLTGHVWTSTASSQGNSVRQPLARIGVDAEGASDSVAAVDVWCAPPGGAGDDVQGWMQSEQAWTRVEAGFVARSDTVTVYLDSETYSTLPWMGVHFDLVELRGPAPADEAGSAGAPAPTPTFAPTATPAPAPVMDPARLPVGWRRLDTASTWSARQHFGTAVFLDRIWILGGDGFYILGDVWSSPDGQSWWPMAGETPWGQRRGHAAVVFRDRLWVLGGESKDGYLRDAWSSSDGQNWTRATDPPWPPRAGHGVAVLKDALYVAGGRYGRDERLRDVWMTRDGEEWECLRETAPWFARADFGFAAHADRLWVIAGESASDVWNSADGRTWNRVTHTANWPGRSGHALLSHDGLLWMIGGLGSSSSVLNYSRVSADGLHWWIVPRMGGEPSRAGHGAVVFRGRIHVMGGKAGVLNGDVWIAEPPSGG